MPTDEVLTTERLDVPIPVRISRKDKARLARACRIQRRRQSEFTRLALLDAVETALRQEEPMHKNEVAPAL